MLEVNRGDRRTRRIAGKSDTVDAETAARSVLAGQSTAIPKTADGAVEMMRHLKVARRTAVNARTSAMRSGPRNLDSGLSEIFIVFQAAVPKLVASKYTTSGVRRPSAL